MSDNVIRLPFSDGRSETWKFPDGTIVTMTAPDNEPPITAERAIYCMSSIMYQIHWAMFQ